MAAAQGQGAQLGSLWVTGGGVCVVVEGMGQKRHMMVSIDKAGDTKLGLSS